MTREIDRRDFRTSRVSDERTAELAERASTAAGEGGLLGVSLPTPTVARVDATTGNAALITFDRPRGPRRDGGEVPAAGPTGGLTGPPGSVDLVQRALEAVQILSPALGLEPGQPAEFTPDPNVQRSSSGASAVHLAQRYKGLPIFQAASAVRFAADGQLHAVVGTTVSVARDLATTPTLSVEEAVRRVVEHLTADDEGLGPQTDEYGQQFTPPRLDPTDFRPTVLARLPNDLERVTLLESGPFGQPIRGGLTWFALSADELRLCWEVIATFPGGAAQYRVLVDAGDGEVLYSHDAVRSVRARAEVFSPDGGRQRMAADLPLGLDRFGLPVRTGLPAGFPRDWVDGDTTAGESAAAFDSDSQAMLRATGRSDGAVAFVPADAGGHEQAILNAFFFASMLHDFFYLLGFREEGGAFQQTSHSGVVGGAPSDRVEVRVYPHPIPRTASMFTPVDGISPVMKLGTVDATGRSTALDLTVVAHEYMHGVTNRLVGGPLDTRALEAPQSRGMGEGWGDYVACTLVGATTVGSWLVGKPGGIRQFRYDETFPVQTEHFGMVGSGRYVAEHAIGELWCATLVDLNREIGDALALQLVVDALKLSPPNPGFLDMRDAILESLDFAEEAGQLSAATAADARARAWMVFARHGMGPNATSNGASLDGVSPDFHAPAALQTPVTGTGGTTVRAATAAGAVVDVPDAGPPLSSPLEISATGRVDTVRVAVDIEHPAVDDLRVELVAPDGTRVRLHDQQPGPADLVTEYTSATSPTLAALQGKPSRGTWVLEVTDLVRKDRGRLRSWQLTLDLATATAPGLVAEVTGPLSVPDSPAPGLVSSQTLDAPGTVGALQVEVDVGHPVPADLVLRLLAPSGRSVVLHDRRDTGRPGVSGTFDQSSLPTLSTLRGDRIAGTWRLEVTDVERKDVGVLNRWALRIDPAPLDEGSGLEAGASGGEVSARDREVSVRLVFPDADEADDFVIAFRGWLHDYRARALLRSALARSYGEAQGFIGGTQDLGTSRWELTPYYLNLVAGW
ncbi:M36 family metallopeptidase [Geodermatophilus sp. SYSU D00697]